jgi:tripeptidyl-peptidase-1
VKNFVPNAKSNPKLGSVTPESIRQEYNITGTSSGRSGKNVQAIASFLKQYFSPDDLDQFLDEYKLPKITPKVIGPNDPSNPGVEASLDIQYILAVGSNITTHFVYTPGEYEHQEPFLNWITNMINLGDQSALVHSVSYGEYEDTISLDYQVRVDQELQKFVATGRTILIASGDYGVGCSSSCSKFVPVWPGGSPHITSVGATYDASEGQERGVRFSGGGFSNHFARPDWQKDAVDQYINVYGPKVDIPDAKWYNASGRAYPDISAFGVDFDVIVGGSSMPVSGTSASTPLVAGVISLLNEVRLKAGKKQLGFLNPLLYQKLEAGLKDITDGRNAYGCCVGFPAGEKWDPVTGLGTPNVGKLIEIVGKL